MDRTVDIDIELSPETMEWDTPIQPMPIFKLDTDFKRALEKWRKLKNTHKYCLV